MARRHVDRFTVIGLYPDYMSASSMREATCCLRLKAKTASEACVRAQADMNEIRENAFNPVDIAILGCFEGDIVDCTPPQFC